LKLARYVGLENLKFLSDVGMPIIEMLLKV